MAFMVATSSDPVTIRRLLSPPSINLEEIKSAQFLCERYLPIYRNRGPIAPTPALRSNWFATDRFLTLGFTCCCPASAALKRIFLLWIYKESVACHFYIISVNFLYASYIWSSPHSQKVRPFLPPTPPPPFPLFHPGQILPKIKLDLKSNYIKPEQNRIKSNPIQSEQIIFKIILVHCCCCCCCLYKCS